MDIQTIASIVGLSSIISVIVSSLFNYIEKRKIMTFEKITQEKERRYQALLAYMLVALDGKNINHIELPPDRLEFLKNMTNEERQKFFQEEVKIYFSFSHLYASDQVLSCLNEFVNSPTWEHYQNTASAMRKDLWK